ncbi:protein trapped in endoderm-1-like isoform X2 [Penaeus monodon]|uniref:protein trapped in endoderm-1-like isoform X2 n=1 Tax=Penaeus monodon TaxID=6687 RepID=UPI0018A73D90|nr:protein trapped in endoderm-1-like isoform X2 [Penaeus monodon]
MTLAKMAIPTNPLEEQNTSAIFKTMTSSLENTTAVLSTGASTLSLPSPWALNMAIVSGLAVSLIGGLGNLVVVTVLVQQAMTRRTLRVLKVTADSVLVLQLAVVDLLYCTVSLPLCVASYLQGEEMPGTLCAFAGFFRLLNGNVEFNTLGLVALERSYHIYRGRSGGGVFSLGRTRMYCVVLWTLGFAFQLPGISMKKYGFNPLTYKCDLLITSPRFRGLLVGLEIMLPMVILIASYVAILRRVRKSKALLAGFSTSKDASGRSAFLARRYRSAGRSVLGLTILYCVCILPMAVYNIVDENGYYKDIGIVLNCLYWIQYAANTAIYGFTNNRFNKAFRILVSCRRGDRGRQNAGEGIRHVGGAFSCSFKRPDDSSWC